MNTLEILTANDLWKKFQRLKCEWMTLNSTGRLAGSDSGYVGNMPEVRTYGSFPSPYV